MKEFPLINPNQTDLEGDKYQQVGTSKPLFQNRVQISLLIQSDDFIKARLLMNSPSNPVTTTYLRSHF